MLEKKHPFAPLFTAALLIALAVFLFSPPPAFSQADFIDVGGREVALGDLVFTAPPGFVRAPAEVEKEQEAYLLGLPAPDESGDMLAVVTINPEPDRFKSKADEKAFLGRIEKNLAREGWKRTGLEIGGRKFQAFRTPSDEGTLYLVLVPHGGGLHRFFINVFGPTKGLPEGIRQLLSAVGSGADPMAAQLPEALAKVVTRAEIEVSNILYGGDIADDTPAGRALREEHARIVEAMDEAFAALDRAHDRLEAASDRFDRVFFEIGDRIDAKAGDAPWAALSKNQRASLAETMALEQAVRAGIKNLRTQLTETGGTPLTSLLAASLRLQTLALYSQAIELQTGRIAGAAAQATALHHLPDSPLPSGLKKELAPLLSEEEEALIGLFAADEAARAALYAVAVGLTGLDEVFRRSLEENIARLEEGLAENQRRLKAWKPGKDQAQEAELIRNALTIYRLQLEDFQQALAILDKRKKTAAHLPGSSLPDRPVLLACLGNGPAAGALVPALAANALAGTGGRYADAVRQAAQPKKEEGYFRRAFRSVQNTVGAAANSVSMTTKLVADKYYSWRENLSEKDSMDQVRQTVREHMGEYERGEPGVGSMRRAIQGFEAVEKGAEDAAAGGVEKVAGKGWLSWGAGKIANAAVSTFTSLGKGVLQTTAHDSTPGERAEGVINIVTSIYGGASNAAKPLTKSATTATKTLVNQSKKTAATLVGSKFGIEAEKTVIKTLGEAAIPEAQKRIAQYTAQRIAATDGLKKAMVDSFKELVKGGSKALSPGNWTAGAKKALAEATRQASGKELAVEMIKKLGPGATITTAIDNAVAAKTRRVVDNMTAPDDEDEEKAKVAAAPQPTPDRDRKKRKPKATADDAAGEETGEDEAVDEEEEDTDEEAEDETGDAAEDEEENEPPDLEAEAAPQSEAEKFLQIVAPVRVVAAGNLRVPTQGPEGKTAYVDVSASVTFWNVGLRGGASYGGATFKYTATALGAVESNTLHGVFSGGPNGSIDLGEVSLGVVGGSQVVIPEWGAIPIQNPGAFADWPGR